MMQPISWYEGALDGFRRELRQLSHALRLFGDGRVKQFEAMLEDLKEAGQYDTAAGPWLPGAQAPKDGTEILSKWGYQYHIAHWNHGSKRWEARGVLLGSDPDYFARINPPASNGPEK